MVPAIAEQLCVGLLQNSSDTLTFDFDFAPARPKAAHLGRRRGEKPELLWFNNIIREMKSTPGAKWHEVVHQGAPQVHISSHRIPSSQPVVPA